jgi:hypothetical protein
VQEIVLVHVILVALEDVEVLAVAIVIIHVGVDVVPLVGDNATGHARHTAKTGVQAVKAHVKKLVNQIALFTVGITVKGYAKIHVTHHVPKVAEEPVLLNVL